MRTTPDTVIITEDTEDRVAAALEKFHRDFERYGYRSSYKEMARDAIAAMSEGQA